MFYSEEGGFISTDENNQSTDKVYYLGVIDILTRYSLLKRAEHFFKSFTQNKDTISAIKPVTYGERFIKFIQNTATINYKKEN